MTTSRATAAQDCTDPKDQRPMQHRLRHSETLTRTSSIESLHLSETFRWSVSRPCNLRRVRSARATLSDPRRLLGVCAIVTSASRTRPRSLGSPFREANSSATT